MEHRQQSRRGLGITDGFAFVPPSVAVSVRHPLGIGTERSPHHQSRETFSRPAKSYLTNSAKCERQRDSAATFRILHKRLRKRDAFCAGVAGRSARSTKSRCGSGALRFALRARSSPSAGAAPSSSRRLSRDFVHWLHIYASRSTEYSQTNPIRLGRARVGRSQFMGRKPKHKAKTQNQIAELSEENRRLREIVAYLSEVVLTRIAETTEPAGNRMVPKPNKRPV
jgi:hypothetical protein